MTEVTPPGYRVMLWVTNDEPDDVQVLLMDSGAYANMPDAWTPETHKVLVEFPVPIDDEGVIQVYDMLASMNSVCTASQPHDLLALFFAAGYRAGQKRPDIVLPEVEGDTE